MPQIRQRDALDVLAKARLVEIAAALGLDVLGRRSKSEIVDAIAASRLRDRAARVGRNPKTGARVEIPAKRVCYFKPGQGLLEVVFREHGLQGRPRTAQRLAGLRGWLPRPRSDLAQSENRAGAGGETAAGSESSRICLQQRPVMVDETHELIALLEERFGLDSWSRPPARYHREVSPDSKPSAKIRDARNATRASSTLLAA